MRCLMMVVVAAPLTAGFSAGAAEKSPALDATVARAVSAAMDRAIAFYRANQDPDGSFAPDKFGPAVTGLAVTGMLRTKRVTLADPMIVRAYAYLEKFVQPDGGLYHKGAEGQKNYMTSIALVAFVEANGDGRHRTTIERAKAFLKGEQWGPDRVPATDPKHGGFGYGSKARPDLSNTSFTLEALSAAGLPKDDPAYQRAVIFLRRCQNFSGEGGNDLPKGAAGDLDGGFVYTPTESMAGSTPTGGLRSYASMTYAGLKSFIHAGLSKDDPRVQAALRWIQQHYSVKENPGLGQSGLYYYYHTFAKALSVLEIDRMTDAAGAKRDWRTELVIELVAKQLPDGSWSNPDKRWLENDKKLATAYALLTLALVAK